MPKRNAQLYISGEDHAYIMAAYAAVGSNEVGGVGHVKRIDGGFLLHSPEILPQTVHGGETDMAENMDKWLQSWLTEDQYTDPMPNVDFLWWHKHPCTGWSGTDEQFIVDHACAGYIVSIVMQSNGKFACRVDTNLAGTKDHVLTIEASMEVVEDRYSAMIDRAREHVKERVAVRKTVTQKQVGGFFSRLPNAAGYGSGGYGSLYDWDAEEPDHGVVRMDDAASRGNRANYPPTRETADVSKAITSMMQSSCPGLYFGKSSSPTVSLFRGSMAVTTVHLTDPVRRILRARLGLGKKAIKRYEQTGKLLRRDGNNHWVEIALGAS
jgi:hypothetical protein